VPKKKRATTALKKMKTPATPPNRAPERHSEKREGNPDFSHRSKEPFLREGSIKACSKGRNSVSSPLPPRKRLSSRASIYKFGGGGSSTIIGEEDHANFGETPLRGTVVFLFRETLSRTRSK